MSVTTANTLRVFRPVIITDINYLDIQLKDITPTHVYTNTSPAKIAALIQGVDALSNVQATLFINGVKKQTKYTYYNKTFI